jgi:hypothetical protein
LLKRTPTLTTDQQAEDFLVRDLSNLDFTQFKPLNPKPTPKRPT